MKTLQINVGYGLTEGKVIHRCSLLCRDGIIQAIGGESAFRQTQYDYSIDLPDCYVMPGLVDSHMYGYMGNAIDGPEGLQKKLNSISKLLLKHGVTSYLPTMSAMPKEKQLQVLEEIVSYIKGQKEGAQACGVHMIGPFIGMEKRGSNPEDGVRAVDFGELDEILKVADGYLKVMTFAPELSGATKLVDVLCENNVLPSMGHSIAGADAVMAAVDAGATRCTHLYNAMSPIHQRNIGLATTVLVDDRITAELIFDGYHSHPQLLDLACRAKGSKKIVAVSAAAAWAGLPDGEYEFGDEMIHIKNQHCVDSEGAIAGSMLTQEMSWKNILKFSHFKNTEAVSCFTANPARDLGLENRGALGPGMRADVIIMNKDHECEVTILGGEVVYMKDPSVLKPR